MLFKGSFFIFLQFMYLDDIYRQFLSSSGVCTDSRKLKPGEIFIAIKGERFDGNAFVRQALEKGACLAISDDDALKDVPGVFMVEDSLAFLQVLARHHRQQLPYPIIALTGSNGKTTTKELIRTLLSTTYRVGVTEGNLNNHIGVPLTLLSFDHNLDMAIVEMGANHVGEIASLCEIALPDYGLITNIGTAHIGEFGGAEAIKKAKGELYEAVRNRGGTIFINRSLESLSDMLGSYDHIVEFTNDKIIYSDQALSTQEGKHDLFASLIIQDDGASMQVVTGLVGNYNYANILGALVVAGYFKVPLQNSITALNDFTLSMNRSQFVESEGVEYILDAYNANPTSMRAALEDFIRPTEVKKAVILGEMKELGTSSTKFHYEILEWLARQDLACVVLVGQAFLPFKDRFEFHFLPSYKEAIELWRTIDKKGWRVLVKGSRAVQLEKILNTTE